MLSLTALRLPDTKVVTQYRYYTRYWSAFDLEGRKSKEITKSTFPVAYLLVGSLSLSTALSFLVRRGCSSRRDTSNAFMFKDTGT